MDKVKVTKHDVAVFDIECFPNYFLLAIKLVGDAPDNAITFEIHGADNKFTKIQVAEIKEILKMVKALIGFNSLSYDVPMLLRACNDGTAKELKEFSSRIIGNRFTDTHTSAAVQAFNDIVYHIDVKACSPLPFYSLKRWAGLLHCQSQQELPIDPDELLNETTAAQIKAYCINDLQVTEDLFVHLHSDIRARGVLSEAYDVNCVNLSRAAVCERIIRQITNTRGQYGINNDFNRKFRYKAPHYVEFQNRFLEQHKKAYEATQFYIKETDKREIVADSVYFKSDPIMFGGAEFNIGIGGIHTNDGIMKIDARENDYDILNFDVGAYYPSLIMNDKLGPKNHTKRHSFLSALSKLYLRRMEAKQNDDKIMNHALKVPLNSVSGKLNGKYSMLYAPDAYIQMTLTGQLLILMLSEYFVKAGAKIYSANTDSLIITFPRNLRSDIISTAEEWENNCNCHLDHDEFLAVYSRDVNSYFAIMLDGSVKRKGCFSTHGTDPAVLNSPQGQVAYDACINRALTRAPLDEYIYAEKRIEPFIFCANSTKGAKFQGTRLGKSFRFIWVSDWVKDGRDVIYRDTEQVYKIPNSSGCQPIMVIPTDRVEIDNTLGKIDRRRYVDLAKTTWESCGGNL